MANKHTENIDKMNELFRQIIAGKATCQVTLDAGLLVDTISVTHNTNLHLLNMLDKPEVVNNEQSRLAFNKLQGAAQKVELELTNLFIKNFKPIEGTKESFWKTN
jgi:hypothetical protein